MSGSAPRKGCDGPPDQLDKTDSLGNAPGPAYAENRGSYLVSKPGTVIMALAPRPYRMTGGLSHVVSTKLSYVSRQWLHAERKDQNSALQLPGCGALCPRATLSPPSERAKTLCVAELILARS